MKAFFKELKLPIAFCIKCLFLFGINAIINFNIQCRIKCHEKMIKISSNYILVSEPVT